MSQGGQTKIDLLHDIKQWKNANKQYYGSDQLNQINEIVQSIKNDEKEYYNKEEIHSIFIYLIFIHFPNTNENNVNSETLTLSTYRHHEQTPRPFLQKVAKYVTLLLNLLILTINHFTPIAVRETQKHVELLNYIYRWYRYILFIQTEHPAHFLILSAVIDTKKWWLLFSKHYLLYSAFILSCREFDTWLQKTVFYNYQMGLILPASQIQRMLKEMKRTSVEYFQICDFVINILNGQNPDHDAIREMLGKINDVLEWILDEERIKILQQIHPFLKQLLKRTIPPTRRHGTDRRWEKWRDRDFRPPEDDLGFGFGFEVLLDESKIGNKMFQLMDDIILQLRIRISNKKHSKMITLHSKL